MEYQRRLPHRQPKGADLFVTWHLHESLPRVRYPPPGKLSSGRAFVWMDRFLDTTREGPMWLRQPSIAQVVENSMLHEVSLGRWCLHAYVIMANHVHVLATFNTAIPELMRSIKGSSAREANRLLARTGQPFWQKESYDHWIRGADEWRRIKAYIENNPLKAGLVQCAEDFVGRALGAVMFRRTEVCGASFSLQRWLQASGPVAQVSHASLLQ